MNTKSQKGQLNANDLKKWLKNMALFLAPLALIYLSSVKSIIDESGFNIDAFIPSSFVIGAMVLYFLNATIDLIKKFASGE